MGDPYMGLGSTYIWLWSHIGNTQNAMGDPYMGLGKEKHNVYLLEALN
jgi:hypothetical protein